MVVGKTYSEKDLSKKTVPQIRTMLRERNVHGVWVASATKKVLIKAYMELDTPLSPAELLERKGVLALRGLVDVLAEMLKDRVTQDKQGKK